MKHQIRHRVIRDIMDLQQHLAQTESIRMSVIQGLNLSLLEVPWSTIDVTQAVFLGCLFAREEDELLVRSRGACVFPRFDGLPYNPYRSRLYTWQELMEGYNPIDDQSLDIRIYRHFVSQGKYNPDIKEALAQRIHDHAIDDALKQFLAFDGENLTVKKAVGIMGGHGIARNDQYYGQAALTAWLLAREGFFVVTGGGPGIMEAGNLGAYMSKRPVSDLEEVIRILSRAPSCTDQDYVDQARHVLESFPVGQQSLAIPTWFYGHEPSNLFASAIAKYFSNSLREDGLLALCLYGIIFSRGSAGTTQEIFMDATQNHYGSFGYYSPMVFLGKQRYLKDTFIYPLVQQLARDRAYSALLHISDSPEDVLAFIKSHPPIKKT